MFFAPVLSLSLVVTRAWALPASSATNGTAHPLTPRAATATIPPQLFSANASREVIRKLADAAKLGTHSRAEYPLWHGSSGTYFDGRVLRAKHGLDTRLFREIHDLR